MKISIIVAIAENNGIGKGNALLYWLPNDLKHFKQLTTGHTIIMGRKTFDSLPKGALPNRRNIVLTHKEELHIANAETFLSLEQALMSCQKEEEVFIIGGASVYKEAMKSADTLYITHIYDSGKEATVFFPTIDKAIWKENSRDDRQKDDKHLHAYSFVEYIKKD